MAIAKNETDTGVVKLRINSLSFKPSFTGINQPVTAVVSSLTGDPNRFAENVAKAADLGVPTVAVGEERVLAGLDKLSETNKAIRFPLEELAYVFRQDKMNQMFGVNTDNLEMSSVLAAAFVGRTIGDKLTPKTALLTDDVNTTDQPLLWLVWGEQQVQKNIATQIVKWRPSSEALLYFSNSLRAYGESGQKLSTVIGRDHWLPSSLLLVASEQLGRLPLTNNQIGSELTAVLGLAETAVRGKKKLLRITVGNRLGGVRFDRKDKQTIELTDIFEALKTEGVFLRAQKGFLSLPAERIKGINLRLGEFSTAQLVPPIKMLESFGCLNNEVLERIRSKMGQKWSGFESRTQQLDLKRIPKLTDRLFPDWDGDNFGKLLKKTYDYTKKLRLFGKNAVEFLRNNVWRKTDKTRPFYAATSIVPDEIKKFMAMGIYNFLPTSEIDNKPASFNLWDDEMGPYREPVIDWLKTANVVALVPFVDEAESLGEILDYVVKRLGGRNKRVIAANHGRDQHTAEIAKKSDVRMANLPENMKLVNWDKLVTGGVIPAEMIVDGQPIGLKGLNVLNGLIELWKMYKAGNIDENTMIMMTDADIVNPGEQTGVSRVDWYDPFLYLGLALKDGVDKNRRLHSVQLAKTGPGRNNMITHFIFDLMANQENEFASKLGLCLSTLVWPHTESRAYRWGDLIKFPLFKDMQIEQIVDTCAAELDLKNGYKGQAQVINPVPKHEVKPSPSHREFTMMQNLARGMNEIIGTLSTSKGFLGMTIEDIGEINRIMAMRANFQSVTIDESHSARRPQYVITDVLLPSIRQLIDNGYLNL